MKMTDIALAQMRAKQARPAPPDLQLGFTFETAIEPNAKAKERIVAHIESAKLAGIVPPDNFDLAPDEQDLVVYKCITVVTSKTPGGISIPGGKLAQVRLRGEEFMRMAMADIEARSTEKLREMFGGSDG